MIRVTQAEYMRDTRALFQRARAERQSIEVVDEAGTVRSIVSLGSGEPEADQDDVGAEVHWAVCIGVVALGEWARSLAIAQECEARPLRHYAVCCMPRCGWLCEIPAGMHGPHFCADCATPDTDDFMAALLEANAQEKADDDKRFAEDASAWRFADDE